MKTLTEILNRHVVPPLTVLSETTCLTAIRSGAVSLVPLTIICGLFHMVCYFPPRRLEETCGARRLALSTPDDVRLRLASLAMEFAGAF